MEESNRGAHFSGAAIAVIVVLVVLIAAVIATIAYLAWPNQIDLPFFPDRNSGVSGSEAGSLEGEGADPILAPDPLAEDGPTPEGEGQEKNKEGEFSYAVNRTPYFETPESKGSLMIGNPPQNRYLMAVEIWLADGGTLVYRSGTLRPNQFITEAPLSRTLEKGVYPAIACFTALDPETGENLGTLEAEIILQVGVRQES